MRGFPNGEEACGVDPPLPAVRAAVALAYAEDVLPLGDLTSSLLSADARGHLSIVAREAGVVAGRLCALEAFGAPDAGTEVHWHAPDGTSIGPGDVVARVTGTLHAILIAERTALNFLGHLSGIASLTRRHVDAVRAVDPRVVVLDTRKTTPGLRALEKAAVRAGGGRNHRANLSDAILIKDNHLLVLSITDAVRRARTQWPGRMVEVECDREEQAIEAAAAGATAVLLDNMTPDEVARCAKAARASAAGDLLVEVSGNVSLETIGDYAAAGVDMISVGRLTHSAPVLDFGLDLDTEG